MLRNYIKLTFRDISKHKLTSTIGILGLSVAVSCCIVLFLFIMNIVNANSFIDNSKDIYMITSKAKKGQGDIFLWGKTPENLIHTQEGKKDSNIDLISRFKYGNSLVRNENKTIEESLQYVDPDFLKIFSFDLKNGSRKVLEDPNSVVLSAEMAEKFFDNEDAIGEELLLIIDGEKYPVKVGAIAEKFPSNAYFKFNILVPYEIHPDDKYTDWTSMTNATFVTLKDPQAKSTFLSEINSFTDVFNSQSSIYNINEFTLISFDQLSSLSSEISYSVVGGENPSTAPLAIGFAILLITIACLNYINIALVTSTRRLKEIGFRKTAGASKKQLVTQFLTQNILICSLAVLGGLFLAQFVLIPFFNSFFPIDFSLDYTDIRIWAFLIFVALVTGIISGIYPALYISSFKVTQIFRSQLSLGGNKNILFRLFLGIQFLFTFFIIFSGVSFIFNSNYQKGLPWGYDNSGLVVVPLYDSSQFKILYNEFIQYPEIKDISGGINQIGASSSKMNITREGEQSQVREYKVDGSYLKTMGFKLLEGNFPNEKLENNIVVNKAFAEEFFIDNAGSFVHNDQKEFQITGIVDDFHYDDFYSPIEPVVFSLSTQEQNKYLILKGDDRNLESINDKVTDFWRETYPDYPYSGYFQKEIFDNYFYQMSVPTNMLMTFSIICIFISAMGLFGLISLMITKKMKELGIRKILGASLNHLTLIVSKPFLLVLLISISLAIPISQNLLKSHLDQVSAYHVPIGLNVILTSLLILIMVVLITVGFNMFKISKAEPMTTLQAE